MKACIPSPVPHTHTHTHTHIHTQLSLGDSPRQGGPALSRPSLASTYLGNRATGGPQLSSGSQLFRLPTVAPRMAPGLPFQDAYQSHKGPGSWYGVHGALCAPKQDVSFYKLLLLSHHYYCFHFNLHLGRCVSAVARACLWESGTSVTGLNSCHMGQLTVGGQLRPAPGVCRCSLIRLTSHRGLLPCPPLRLQACRLEPDLEGWASGGRVGGG
jgi:hypothetical protein